MIAQNGACCISVGLELTLYGPQVRFNVSLGPHHISGPFFGATTIAMAVAEISNKLETHHYKDFLTTMNELWPATGEQKVVLGKLLEGLSGNDNRPNGSDVRGSSEALLRPAFRPPSRNNVGML